MIHKPFIKKLSLEHNPTVWEYMQSPAFVRAIIGPLGSGKTTGTCGEVMKIAMGQTPSPDNIRRVKTMVVRNTYAELKSTTVKTWLSMYPEAICGQFRHQPPFEHRIKIPKGVGGAPGMEMLVEFVAMDRPKDVRKLLSWEGGVIWFNELREIGMPIFNQATGRVGRYPSMEQGGVFCTRKAVLGDSNAMDADHWVNGLRMARPEGYEFFIQPPAIFTVEEALNRGIDVNNVRIVKAAGKSWVLNLGAENLPNLDDTENPDPKLRVPIGTYYYDQIPGKPLDWLESYLQVKFVFVSDGRPCVPSYNDQVHSFNDLPIMDKIDLEIGIDCGGGTLEPSAIIGQTHPRGNKLAHAEICAKDMGVRNFIEEIHHTLAGTFKGRKVKIGWGDPAGNNRDEVFEVAILQHFRTAGIPVTAAPTNDPAMRIQAWNNQCDKMIDGKPGLMIHTRCQKLRKGLSGKWFFKKKQISGTEQFHLTPEKNEYSHPCDAGGYWLLGSGGFQSIKGREQTQNQVHHQADMNWSPFDF